MTRIKVLKNFVINEHDFELSSGYMNHWSKRIGSVKKEERDVF